MQYWQNIAGWCQQTFERKKFVDNAQQSFPPIIWIFIEGECDWIESRLPFKIFSTLQKSGGAKRRLFVENDVASATVLGDKKTQVRTILPYSKDSAEYLEWKKTQPRKAEKSNERAENNKNLSTKNIYDFVEEPIEKSINTIQSWRKLQKSGGAKRMLFEGNNVALATVLGDTGTLSSSDPVIAQSTSQHLKKNPSEKPKKKPESKFKCDRSNDKVGDNESENPEFLELRNKKNKKCEEQYEKWRNSAEYLDWKKTEKRPTSKKPQKKVQTDTILSTKAEPEVGNSKKRKISETFANRRKKIHDDWMLKELIPWMDENIFKMSNS